MSKPIIKKSTKALVVGSGAAGLNAVDELLKMAVETLLVTDRISGGTSFNEEVQQAWQSVNSATRVSLSASRSAILTGAPIGPGSPT